jgi:peroxiredoxin Q/BCP
MPRIAAALAGCVLFAIVALGAVPTVGDRAPDFSLPSTSGKTVSLKSYLGKSKVVLVFYRGYWWPYCRKQLAGLAADYQKFADLGAEIIAISVDNTAKSREMAEKLKLTFPVLSDTDHKVIDAYDLYNAEGKIAKPALFVIDKRGVVRWVFLNEDYRIRAVDDSVLDELKKLK